MKTPPSFLLVVAALLCLASPLFAASSPMWQFPSDGEVFGKSTTGAVKPNEGVEVIMEVPRSIPAGYYAEIFTGTTSLGYAYNTANTGPRRFQSILSIFTTGTHTLSAKVGDGFTVTTIEGPTIQIVSPFPAPTFYAEAPLNVSALGMEIRAGVDLHGAGANTVRFEYGRTTAYGNTAFVDASLPTPYTPGVRYCAARIGAPGYYSSGTPLQPETEYHYRLVVDGVPGPDHVVVTSASLPPQANEDILVLNGNGVAEGGFLDNDSDEGIALYLLPANWLTLGASSTPSHGQVQLSLDGRTFRYTADSSFEDTDEFTYIVRDPHGGEATGRVLIRGIAAHFAAIAGTYSSVFLNDSQVPIGTFTLQITKDGRYTGAIVYYGKRFTIAERFTIADDVASAMNVQLSIAREGQPPLSLDLYLYSGAGNVPTLTGILEGGGDGAFSLPETPQSVPPSENVPEAGQFNIAIANPNAVENDPATAPDEEDLFGVPQGQGFARMRVSRHGSIQVIGKTADNRPFTVGSRIRKDRKVIVNSKVGSARKGTLFGLVGFDLASRSGGTGDLVWNNPESESGSYRSAFNMTVGAIGRAFVPVGGRSTVFEFPPDSPRSVQVTVRNHAGGIITQQTRNLDSHNRLTSDRGAAQRIQIALDPKTGLFSGKVLQTGKPAVPVTGIIQPALRRGVGISGKTGFEGTVELLAL